MVLAGADAFNRVFRQAANGDAPPISEPSIPLKRKVEIVVAGGPPRFEEVIDFLRINMQEEPGRSVLIQAVAVFHIYQCVTLQIHLKTIGKQRQVARSGYFVDFGVSIEKAAQIGRNGGGPAIAAAGLMMWISPSKVAR